MPSPAAATPQRTRDLADPRFWRDHFPGLTLLQDARCAAPVNAEAGEADHGVLWRRMLEEGYIQDRNAAFEDLAPRLAEAVRACVALNIPPVFVFLFDEAWACFRSLEPMLNRMLGSGYRMLPDFWAWHVDPQAGEAGWAPHRDKGRHALAPDGSPLSLTVWAPLSDATPLSSCMYVVPANQDPSYNTPHENSLRFALPAVRALPGAPGDYFCWNQAILHWGSQSSRFAEAPRISMALEFQRRMADRPKDEAPDA